VQRNHFEPSDGRVALGRASVARSTPTKKAAPKGGFIIETDAD
jgi:hypothetical protein